MKSIQTRKSRASKTLGFVALVAVFLALSSGSLLALTTLHVTIGSDNNPGGIGEIGDLRFALNSMNQDLNTTPDDYAIVFDTPMTIQINGILPIINNSPTSVNITIGDPGPVPTVTIDGNNGTYPGFFVAMGNVTIQNMIFQNLTAKGGNGGDGISGGGGGLGAGGAIFAPQTFLNRSYPSITLINVSINNCSAIGGNGGSHFALSSTGNEGGGGGGGLGGNGGSILTIGSTGGGGGGGFGGNGGDVTLSTEDLLGGGGGGGGGLGSRATIGTLTNLGNGGADQGPGLDGNGYGLTITAGSGAGGNTGGNNAGGGGGGGAIGQSTIFGGGGGGSAGSNGSQGQGNIPPRPYGMAGPSPDGVPPYLPEAMEETAVAGAVAESTNLASRRPMAVTLLAAAAARVAVPQAAPLPPAVMTSGISVEAPAEPAPTPTDPALVAEAAAVGALSEALSSWIAI